MIRSWSLARLIALAAALLLLLPPVADAYTYRQNRGALGAYQATGQVFNGLAGFQMLTQITAHNGYAVVHPGQFNPSFAGGDFYGFGTANGAGVDNCPDYYGTQWQVYIDGQAFGLYFCSALEYIAGNAQSQSFIIELGAACPHETGAGMHFLWQQVDLTCEYNSFTTTDQVSAGAENVLNYPNQALRIEYVQLQYRIPGSAFAYWPTFYATFDTPYTITRVGTGRMTLQESP